MTNKKHQFNISRMGNKILFFHKLKKQESVVKEVEKQMAVEKKLSEYIESTGLKKQFIAEKSGVDYQVLCRCLNEKQPLKANEFLAVCKVLEVNPESFLNE